MRYLYLDLKPQNLRDWSSESAIDPINPLVYIQASYLALRMLKTVTMCFGDRGNATQF